MSEIKQKVLSKKLEIEAIDVTMPGEHRALGHKHPLSIVQEDINENYKNFIKPYHKRL